MSDVVAQDDTPTLVLDPVTAVPASARVRRANKPRPAAPGSEARGQDGAGAAVLGWSVAAVSVLALWLALNALVLGALQERVAQARLYATFREQLALATAPLGPTVPGRPVALLQSNAPGLRELVVVEGTSAGQTQLGPGHRRNTPLPGQPGVSVLYGRGATFGAPFGQLATLRTGDQLTLTTGQGRFGYRVDGVRRSGDLVPIPPPAGGARLTLVSVEGQGWRAGWAPTSTVYVDATLQGPAKLAASARPASVGPSEQAMAGDTAAVVPLVLWLQALLLAGSALAWLFTRWGLWQTWVVGSPVVLALLWQCTRSALQLLPNLL